MDGDTTTGWVVSADVGSELVVNGNALYRQAAGLLSAGFVRRLPVEPHMGVTDLALAVRLSALPTRKIRPQGPLRLLEAFARCFPA